MEVENMSKSNTMESAQLTDAMYYILLSLMIEESDQPRRSQD